MSLIFGWTKLTWTLVSLRWIRITAMTRSSKGLLNPEILSRTRAQNFSSSTSCVYLASTSYWWFFKQSCHLPAWLGNMLMKMVRLSEPSRLFSILLLCKAQIFERMEYLQICFSKTWKGPVRLWNAFPIWQKLPFHVSRFSFHVAFLPSQEFPTWN